MKSRKFVLALTGLAVLCVCATIVAGCIDTPIAMGDGTGREDIDHEKIAEKSIDSTTSEMALENGDQEIVRASSEKNRTADAPEMDGRSQEESKIQFALQKMAENGIDTTEAEVALENGDMETVYAFMQENRPEDAGTG